VMQGGISIGNEYTMVRKDGTRFPVIVYSSRILHDGKVAGIRGIVVDITMLREAEKEKDLILQELKDALSNVKMLSGLLPICTSCKKIRDEEGYWKKLESFITEHSEVSFSFHACPECSAKLYPGEEGKERLLPSLTAREKEVLQWVRQGKSNWEIAAILGISERTVKYHVSGILNKLDVVTRAQAVAVALELGLIED
jgi:DNA-binding CsgD family transcriptional regulator